MVSGHIQHVPAAQVAIILAGLVRQGVTFNVTPEDDEGTHYNIELTGGH